MAARGIRRAPEPSLLRCNHRLHCAASHVLIPASQVALGGGMWRVLGLCCVVLLAGCVRKTEAAFSAAEAAFIKQQGKGVITGHAFRTRPKGQIVNAAGEVVWLVPQTAHSRERFANFFGNRKYVRHAHRFGLWASERNVEYEAHTRQTKTESNGRFAFKDVAPGSYFVMSQVTWGEEDDLVREGGFVYDAVTLTGKETEPVHLVLSGN